MNVVNREECISVSRSKEGWIFHRQYTLTCEDDMMRVCQGYCPDYALSWSEEWNKRYWDAGHNYIGDLTKRERERSLSYMLKRKIKDSKERKRRYSSDEEISLFPTLNNKKNKYYKKVGFEIFSEVVVFDEDLSLLEERIY